MNPVRSARPLDGSLTILRASCAPLGAPTHPTQAGTTAVLVMVSSNPTVDERSGTRCGMSSRSSLSRSTGSIPVDHTSASRAPSESMADSHPRTRALLRSTRILTMERICLSHIIHWPVSTGDATLPAAHSPADVHTVSPQMRSEIIHEVPPHMPQTIHPIDQEIDEMDATHRAMVRLFARDGHIDESERSIIDRFLNHVHDISGYRMRERAADAFKRNGASDLTGRHFKDAGFALVDLEAERKNRPNANVVKFPIRQQAG